MYKYLVTICKEWKSRGYKDTVEDKALSLWLSFLGEENEEVPFWFGDEKFHASHRSNLLRKKPEYYNQFGWTEPDNLDYYWPVTKETVNAI